MVSDRSVTEISVADLKKKKTESDYLNPRNPIPLILSVRRANPIPIPVFFSFSSLLAHLTSSPSFSFFFIFSAFSFFTLLLHSFSFPSFLFFLLPFPLLCFTSFYLLQGKIWKMTRGKWHHNRVIWTKFVMTTSKEINLVI